MKELILVKKASKIFGYSWVFTPDNIVKKVDFRKKSQVVIVPDSVDKDVLKKLIKYTHRSFKRDITNVLRDNNIEYTTTSYYVIDADQNVWIIYPNEKDVDKAIAHISDFETIDAIEYWDGHVIKTVILDPEKFKRIDVVVDDEPHINLDNQRSEYKHLYRSPNEHIWIYKVIRVNDSEPTDDQKYLLYRFLSVDGDVPRAKFISSTELKNIIDRATLYI